MLNRYRIHKDGRFEFYTFKQNTFNKDVWLEDEGNFELKEDGSYYDFYLEDGTPDLISIQGAEQQADIEKAKAYLSLTDWVEPYIIKHRLGLDVLPADSNKLTINKLRDKAREKVNGINIKTI